MPKKSIRLDYRPEVDYLLLGIASPENDYRMSWKLNQALGWSLSKTNPLAIHLKKKEVTQEFALFSWLNEDRMIQYHLIANKSETGTLLEELRTLDYVLKISGEIDDVDVKAIQKKIRELENITTVQVLDPEKLKSKGKLVF